MSTATSADILAACVWRFCPVMHRACSRSFSKDPKDFPHSGLQKKAAGPSKAIPLMRVIAGQSLYTDNLSFITFATREF